MFLLHNTLEMATSYIAFHTKKWIILTDIKLSPGFQRDLNSKKEQERAFIEDNVFLE